MCQHQEAFIKAVENHDVSHSFSDDIEASRKGRQQWKEIQKLAQPLCLYWCADRFNEVADRRFHSGHPFTRDAADFLI